LLGKGPNVSLQFNGETIDVGQYTAAADTAKLRLTGSSKGNDQWVREYPDR